MLLKSILKIKESVRAHMNLIIIYMAVRFFYIKKNYNNYKYF
jgi:hypothetical protein